MFVRVSKAVRYQSKIEVGSKVPESNIMLLSLGRERSLRYFPGSDFLWGQHSKQCAFRNAGLCGKSFLVRDAQVRSQYLFEGVRIAVLESLNQSLTYKFYIG
jgi:hypothetical protein